MIRRPMLRTPVFAAVLLLGACAKAPAVGEGPKPAVAFAAALAAADRRADAGDYSGADRILADFGQSAKGTPEALEVSFWRAMYIVDPANRTASLGEGIRALDIYLATPGTSWYRAPALVLRRTAQSVQSLRAQQPVRVASGRDTVFVSREDEIASLRDQLAKANAELERIKKRLANPER